MKDNQIPDNLNDGNEESNLHSKRDWQTLKKIILNRDHLLVFIAVSTVVIDLFISINFISPLRTQMNNGWTDDASFNAASENGGEEGDLAGDAGDDCNVSGLNLHGDLTTYIQRDNLDDQDNLISEETASEYIYFAIKEAEDQENIKAVVLEIDSFGGSPVAAEEIEKALKSSTKPVIAYIREAGASAAYWAATGADRIFASPSSQVGSIAVNISYLDEVKNNEQGGYNFNDLSTGKFKNTLNSNKPLTEEEKSLVMKDLYITHDLFVKTVADNRKLDINKVKEIANGWAYTGTESLKLGLIDELGGLDEVKSYLEKNILNNIKANICW